MLHVEVNNRQSSLRVDESRLGAAVRDVLRGEGLAAGTVSVAIVDAETSRELNRRYLNHDYPTDVLSFVLDAARESWDGEIIVNAEEALENAHWFGWNADDELLLYAVHGALHLAGYDDAIESAAADMRAREDHWLGVSGLRAPRQPSAERVAHASQPAPRGVRP